MWKLKNKEYQTISMAFLAGYAGILMANYGNEVMTQFPISLVTFTGIAFIINMQYWDENGVVQLPDGDTPRGGAYQATSRWKKENPKDNPKEILQEIPEGESTI